MAIMTRGDRGAVGATAHKHIQVNAVSSDLVDTTGAGDAFAAGLSYAVSLRWPLDASLNLANAVASYAVGALGAQTALPSLVDALARANVGPDFARDSRD
jgi:ribokinase